MKLDHETIQRNYQKAVEYVKTHYPDVSLVQNHGNIWYQVSYFDAITQMEYEIKGGHLYFTVKNGDLLLGRNTNGNESYPDIKIIEHPSDVDIITFLGRGWYDLKRECETVAQRYVFVVNFDPEQEGIDYRVY